MATQVDTTRQVLEHHLAAFGAGHLHDILSDYTDDSILIGPDGALKGRPAIQGFFEGVLSSLFKPGTYQFTMDTLHVADGVAYLVWHERRVQDIDQDRGGQRQQPGSPNAAGQINSADRDA